MRRDRHHHQRPAATAGEPRPRAVEGLVGPGVVTGAADDDPSGIATYSQTGAQFGLGQLWTALFMLPLQIGVQEACARIGVVTGQGLAATLRQRYPRWVLWGAVALLVIANTINIGADIGAMAAAMQLVAPLPLAVWAVLFAGLVLALEIFLSYRVYSRLLKWLALSLLAYPITAVISGPAWGDLLRATFVPHVEFSFAFLFIVTGVLGTTISPYMFFWETSEEVEEGVLAGRIHLGRRRIVGWREMRRLRVDNALGMFLSEAATWSIIVTTATVLHANGVTTIDTAADAARALEPLAQGFPHAGYLAKVIFATGIVGLGLLAVPVLAGSAAYALSEAFGWREGLDRKPAEARGFYAVIALSTLAGLGLNFVGIDPIRALIVAAVINGVVAAPLIFLIARIAGNRGIMGANHSRWLSKTAVWTAFALMSLAALLMFWTLLVG
jgi:Mn2+/Fe2+ NRAMP family transporter